MVRLKVYRQLDDGASLKFQFLLVRLKERFSEHGAVL